jgi:hypothetical protein
MIKKINFEKKGLNLKTKILIFLLLFLLFEYLNYKFWSNYSLQTPIIIKFQSPIIKKKRVSDNKQPTKTSQERAKFGQILAKTKGVESQQEFRPEMEAIYIFFGKDITAYAIAMAESGLNCQRVSKTNDYGLMQIHLPLHQWRFDKFGGKWDNCWDNVKVAYEIYKERKWNAWVVYSTGVYKNYLEQAKLLVNSYFEGR